MERGCNDDDGYEGEEEGETKKEVCGLVAQFLLQFECLGLIDCHVGCLAYGDKKFEAMIATGLEDVIVTGVDAQM